MLMRKKIFGLKSHERHIILQHLLPFAVRRILPEMVSAAVIRISIFFKKLSSPIIRISDMESLEAVIAETLSLLETIFLPSFLFRYYGTLDGTSSCPSKNSWSSPFSQHVAYREVIFLDI